MPFGPFDSFTDCMDRFAGEVDDPAAFCQWLGQEHGWSDHALEEGMDKEVVRKAVAAFWEAHPDGVTLSRDEVRAMCAECADGMATLSLSALRLTPDKAPPQKLADAVQQSPDLSWLDALTSIGKNEQAAFWAWLMGGAAEKPEHSPDHGECPPGQRLQDGECVPIAERNSGIMVGLFPERMAADALALREMPGAEPPEELHITLAFLGDHDEVDEETKKALPKLVHEWALMAFPLEGKVSGVGRFTDREHVHPFWAAVDIKGIHDVRHSLVSYLASNGVPVRNEHEFTPHMTLAYVGSDEPDPVEKLTPHPLHFSNVTLAIGGERHVFPLGMEEADIVAGPFFEKAEKQEAGEERIAYAAVLVPGEPDSDGDILSPADVERVAHLWMEKYQNIDLQHTLNNVDVVPVESYITTTEMPVAIQGNETTLPVGTWVLAGKARDARVWDSIKSGELAGYSVMAVPNAVQKSALKSEGEDAALKQRTMIRDLGPDWAVPFVSVVDAPAVPKARWFALKSAVTNSPANGEKQAELLRQLEAAGADGFLTRALKEGRKFSDATYNQLKTVVDTLSALMREAEDERREKGKQEDDMDEQEVRDLVKNEVSEAVAEAVKAAVGEKPLSEQIAEALKAQSDAAAGHGETPDGEGEPHADDATDAESDAVKELRADLDSVKSTLSEIHETLTKRAGSGAAAKTSRGIQGQDGGGQQATPSRREAIVTTASGKKYKRDGVGRSVEVRE